MLKKKKQHVDLYLFILKSRWPASLTPKCSGVMVFSPSPPLSIFCQTQKDDVKWIRVIILARVGRYSDIIKSERVCACVCVRERGRGLCSYKLEHYGKVKLWIIERPHYFEMPFSAFESMTLLRRHFKHCEMLRSNANGGLSPSSDFWTLVFWHEGWNFVAQLPLTERTTWATTFPLVRLFLVHSKRHLSKTAHFLFILQKCASLKCASHRSILGMARGGWLAKRVALSIYQRNIAGCSS